MQAIIDTIYTKVLSEVDEGRLADYIPQLAEVDSSKFGLSLVNMEGQRYECGNCNEPFSIQSISKVFAVAMAFGQEGDTIWKRVGNEPSGSSFHSLVQLEYENGIPRNPLINAGALVICDILLDLYEQPLDALLLMLRKLAGDDHVSINEAVKASERAFGFRNIALANFIKSFGNIRHDTEEVLDLYFSMCAIEMTCRQLATSFLVFAYHGIIPGTGEILLTVSQTKRLNALMQTCGFYDEAGDFTFKVGLPGKSGVGGGIAAILPRQYSVAVWSPLLNPKGNSSKGLRALEMLTTLTGYSIF